MVSGAHQSMPKTDAAVSKLLSNKSLFSFKTLGQKIAAKVSPQDALQVAQAVTNFYEGDILKELGASDEHRDAVISDARSVVKALTDAGDRQ